MKHLFIILSLVFIPLINLCAQIVFVSTEDDELYQVDMENCTSTFIATSNRQLFDISFHPDGTLYGISGNGDFFTIDTNTGATNIIHTFSGDNFNSLTIDGNGLVYAAGADGVLFTYDIVTSTETTLGFIFFSPAGDLTFFQGELYLASTSDRIVQIDLDNLSNNFIVFEEEVPGDILGIISYAQDCGDIVQFAITDGNSSIYQIDFDNNGFSLVCGLPFEVFGGASTFDFFASNPITIQNEAVVTPTCGASDGSISIEVTGGNGPITFSIDGITQQTNGTFENLPPGGYTVTISDDFGCILSDEFDLTPPAATIITIENTNSTCDNATGSIIINAVGGTGALTYSIDGINFQTSNIFEDLGPGNYAISVNDQNNCSVQGTSTILLLQAPIVSNISTTNATCGAANGSITISANGGSGTIEYSIDGINFLTSNVFENLSAGNYSITIKDEQNCNDTVQAEVSADGRPMITDIVTDDIGCNETTGSITISATGGTGALAYSIDGINFQSSNVFDNLPPGFFPVTISDANNCSRSSLVEIEQQTPPTIADIDQLNTMCGEDNGAIIIIASGGTGQLQYSIDGINFQGSNVFNQLPAGGFNISVYDANNCRDIMTIEILEESPINIANIVTTNTTCNASDGSITIVADGGVGDIEYSIDGINFQPENVFFNLAAGSFNITINDDNNCNEVVIADVLTDSGPTITEIVSNDIGCGETAGSIIISAMGGVGDLEYSLDGISFQTDSIFTALPLGSFNITVQDSNDCEVVSTAEIIQLTPPAIVGINQVNNVCGEENGSVTIMASGGTGTLEYTIDGGVAQTSNVFNNLPSGPYNVAVTDTNDCTAEMRIEIQEESSLSVTNIVTTRNVCDQSNGTITISATGGSGTYEFSLDGTNFQTSNVFDNLPTGTYVIFIRDENNCIERAFTDIQTLSGPIITNIESKDIKCDGTTGSLSVTSIGGTPGVQYSIDGINFQGSSVFENLPAGNYDVTVKDANDCSFTSEANIFALAVPTIVDIEQVNTICGNEGSVTIAASGGTGVLQYSIDGTNFQTSNIFNNLPPGDFSIIVSDSNNCSDMISGTIAGQAPPNITFIEPTNLSCNNDQGALSVMTTGDGMLTFSIDGTNFQSSNLFENLAPGNYDILVVDENDCQDARSATIINTETPTIANITTSNAICGENNGQLIVETNNGDGQLINSLNGDFFQTSLVYDNLEAGEYNIQIIDESDCMVDTTFTIGQEECPIYIPNIFSPNNDGNNDVFQIYPHPEFRGAFTSLRVFDRWGALMYEAKDFDPDSTYWNGRYRGQSLDPGVYMYTLSYTTELGDTKTINGDLTIIDSNR